MVVNAVRIILFVLGGAVAVAGTAYVTGALDALLPARQETAQPELAANEQATRPVETGGAAGPVNETDDEVAAASEDGAAQDADAAPAGQREPRDSAALSLDGQGEDPARSDTTPAQDGLIDPDEDDARESASSDGDEIADRDLPTFELLRVERDGSTVIAGRAAPQAEVQVVTGSNVLGEAVAGASGEFVVVLEERLPAGDYSIVLRATNPDEVVVTSEQTAVVAVPDSAGGQVLALVEEPGAPSRLITVPDAPAAADEEASAEDAASATDTPSNETIATADRAAPSTAGEDAEAATGEAARAESETSSDSGEAREEAAVAAPAAPPAVTQAPAVPSLPRVAVEAVEIEGRNVFVAGRAPAERQIRVYANEYLLGQTRVSENGRFLIETERDLPVGDYIIRADVLGEDDSTVVARAVVPFEREPGEQIAAIAPRADGQPSQPRASTSQDAASRDPAAPEGTMQGTPGTSQGRGVGQPSASSGEAETGDASASRGQGIAAGERGAGEQSGDEAALTEASRRPGEAAPTSGEAAREIARTDTEIGGRPVETGTRPAPGQDGADSAVTAVDEITAPALQSGAGSVIIRRGDTLWQISRRVYGRGLRYSTIYLANQDQIRNPDRIWPGQVFDLPNESREGEPADLSGISEQIERR